MKPGYAAGPVTLRPRLLQPANADQTPVFIIGIWKRSGTNFVADLLRLHPAFAVPPPLWEDYSLHSADLLENFTRQQLKRWQWWLKEASADPEEYRQSLLQYLGHGLEEFFLAQIPEGKRLLCKTPSTRNLDKFFSLFPTAKLILLVRDGRDVVESACRSWPSGRFGFYTRQWRDGARTILDFISGTGAAHADQWILCRYEELIRGGDAVSQLADFLHINDGVVDWQNCHVDQIRGSSTDRGKHEGVSWQPVSKPTNFNPVGRSSSWGWWRRHRFSRIAAREMNELGYGPSPAAPITSDRNS